MTSAVVTTTSTRVNIAAERDRKLLTSLQGCIGNLARPLILRTIERRLAVGKEDGETERWRTAVTNFLQDPRYEGYLNSNQDSPIERFPTPSNHEEFVEQETDIQTSEFSRTLATSWINCLHRALKAVERVELNAILFPPCTDYPKHLPTKVLSALSIYELSSDEVETLLRALRPRLFEAQDTVELPWSISLEVVGRDHQRYPVRVCAIRASQHTIDEDTRSGKAASSSRIQGRRGPSVNGSFRPDFVVLKEVRVSLKRSLSGLRKSTIRSAESLGLKRLNTTRVVSVHPSLVGMIEQVFERVEVCDAKTGVPTTLEQLRRAAKQNARAARR